MGNPASGAAPKRRRLWLWIVLVALGIGAVGFVGGLLSAPDAPPGSSGMDNSQQPAPTPTPETRLRNRTALEAGVRLKATMRDPDSLAIDGAWASHDGKILCVEYRAKNGFGGMNREQAAWEGGTPRSSSAFWNTHCTSGLDDVTELVRTGAKLN